MVNKETILDYIIFLLTILAIPLVLQISYNVSIASIFEVSNITYLQMAGLMVLVVFTIRMVR